jgi:hypothetical protein
MTKHGAANVAVERAFRGGDRNLSLISLSHTWGAVHP